MPCPYVLLIRFLIRTTYRPMPSLILSPSKDPRRPGAILR